MLILPLGVSALPICCTSRSVTSPCACPFRNIRKLNRRGNLVFLRSFQVRLKITRGGIRLPQSPFRTSLPFFTLPKARLFRSATASSRLLDIFPHRSLGLKSPPSIILSISHCEAKAFFHIFANRNASKHSFFGLNFGMF